jgi:Protein of unknown function (DUF3987)
VFSTSTLFEPERGYSKFAAYALLAHGGDHSAAARALAAQGFGDNERNERDERRAPKRTGGGLVSSNSFVSYAPTLEPAAFHGITGRVVRTLEPHTEADPAGLLLSFLVSVGNIVGPGPHAMAEAMPHPARLNVVLVGRTSKSRKGSALAQIRRLLDLVDPLWAEECILPGLASGEALIAEIRDGTGDDDLGVADKRRLVEEPEFARLLAVAGREGATLSHVVRDAWDGRRLKNRTKRDPLVATGAHISVVGHITREELLRRLDDTEIANGFANRFVFALVRRSKQLPEGGNLDPAALDDLAVQVGAALDRARRVGLMTRSPAAKELWAKAYEDLTDDTEEGLVASVTARAEAQALRLSVAYALLDGSPLIDVEHLEAALAVWRYCEDSARLVFGDATGDPIADRLLAAFREAGSEGLDYTAQSALFGRNVPAARLAHAREQLEARGEVETVAVQTGGRNRMVTRIKQE